MPRQDEHAFLQQALRQDAGAVAFCETLFRISQTLDDLIDGDKPVTGDVVVSAFWQALIELPGNPFYRQHEPYLRPLMAGALQDWRDSVALERSGSQHERTLAFVLRDQLTSVVVQCAYLIGGEAWMRQAGPAIRRHFHEDSLEDYLAELDPTQDPDYQADVDESLNGGDQ
ncbi:hypothetical protein RAN53_09635 [Halomonas sp. SSL-5]|uniref:hypothetical protein n=1 Tax=Halomonas sp. SSL-5 TaxID=3065855 RepID=UPI00273A0A89|nr:hypothetical protein [Halomonas sp. SSL-5]MDY7116611.1 hypothetical protein [Halomonas sp. SSL-5]